MEKEKFSTKLPEDFDGVFRFTNWTEEEFTAKWGGKKYTYPPLKTTPMIIMDASPVEVMQIRKKFARELATREFFKSKQAKSLTEKKGELNSIFQANTYSDNDIAPYVQKCLDPLPVGRAIIEEAEKEPTENRLTRTPRGKLRTRVLNDEESLVDQAKGATAVE